MSRTRVAVPVRLLLRACLLLCLLGATAPQMAQNRPSAPRKGRDVLALHGLWKFRTDPEKRGHEQGWVSAIPPESKTTPVPALWGVDAAPDYAGTAWYWREFETPAGWKGQAVRLRLEGIADRARLWLNGEKIGDHAGRALPFEANVTKLLKSDGINLLAARVEGNAKRGAGLWQPVLLMAHDEAYLADCFANTDGLGHLNAQVTLQNTSDKSGDANLDGRIVAANAPTRDLLRTSQILHVSPGRNVTTLLLTLRGKKLERWSPQTPFLYHLQLAFRQGPDILDTLETTFGFREFGMKERAITVNGRPIALTAVTAETEKPVVIATTEDAERARESLRRLKDKGVNLVYLDAPPAALLDIADQEGMLVAFRLSGGSADRLSAEDIRALVTQYRSHPCILAWNLGDVDSETAQQARQLDPTRFLLTGPSSAPVLWLPHQNEPHSAPPPSDLLPIKNS